MIRIVTFIAILTLATVLPSLAAQFTFEDLYHFTPETAATTLGKAHAQTLQFALEDFNAVLRHTPPVHAVSDRNAPLPGDGGTSFYKANGYTLTISKSLYTLGQGDHLIHGYMYGPILDLGSILGSGNSEQLSQVTFYPIKTLNDLLKENRPSPPSQ